MDIEELSQTPDPYEKNLPSVRFVMLLFVYFTPCRGPPTKVLTKPYLYFALYVEFGIQILNGF